MSWTFSRRLAMKSKQEVYPSNLYLIVLGLDSPLFLLPFRPSSDLSSTKIFIRRYFAGGRPNLFGSTLAQELRLTDVSVLSGILRWIWTRLEGGIVGWESYELFAQAERGKSPLT